ncbi:MAG: hypothetical protein K2I47_02475 [Odoribacter sp.]|nr:hypothetical protein [Odoribacter sp.]
MKKFLFFIAITSISIIIGGCKQEKKHEQNKDAAVQNENTVEERVQHMVERLNKELKLSDKQQRELKTYFTESFQKREKNFPKDRGKIKEMHEKIKKEQEETNEQLKQILTEEQYNIYKENEKKRQKARNLKYSKDKRGSFPR